MSGLFPTGVDNAGVALVGGEPDPHYTLVGSDDPAFVPPYLAPVMVDGYPIGGGVWVDNTTTSKWISVQSGNSGSGGSGNFTFRTVATLSEVDPATAALNLKWSADNSVVLVLNGTPLTFASPSFTAYESLSSTGPMGFVAGANNLDFVVNNGGGPLGLRVDEISITANCTADSQCSSTARWCDGTFNGTPICEDKVANGVAIEGGTCSAALAARSCLTGVCSTTDNRCGLPNGVASANVGECRSNVRHTDGVCGLPNGTGACTAGNAGLVCRSGLCSGAGVCIAAGACASDDDCAGAWCNISANTCTPKLPNERPIPTDTGHTTPVLNGTCSEAAAALTCASGVCDADNACGYADGSGSCNAGNAATVCRTGACRSSGVCGRDAVVTDAGAPSDAGSSTDAGSTATDASSPRVDAATPVVLVDAGGPALVGAADGSIEGGGSGCSASPVQSERTGIAALMVAAVLFVARKRRAVA